MPWTINKLLFNFSYSAALISAHNSVPPYAKTSSWKSKYNVHGPKNKEELLEKKKCMNYHSNPIVMQLDTEINGLKWIGRLGLVMELLEKLLIGFRWHSLKFKSWRTPVFGWIIVTFSDSQKLFGSSELCCAAKLQFCKRLCRYVEVELVTFLIILKTMWL